VGIYACWNPDHLELVTHAENQSHLRKTYCRHGHPLFGANLRIGPNGVRACRHVTQQTSGRFEGAGPSTIGDPS
jgi:hypothetical protein